MSRITIRKAIEILRDDGLLRAERGRGTFVADAPQPVAPTALHVFLDDILARAEILAAVEHQEDEVPATAELARAFGLKPETRVVRLRRRMVATRRGSQEYVWANLLPYARRVAAS